MSMRLRKILIITKSSQPKPVVKRMDSKYYWYECPKCGNTLHDQTNYCPHCGLELIWQTEQEE